MIKLLFVLLFSFNSIAAINAQAPVRIIEDIFTKAKEKEFKNDLKAQKFVTSFFDYDYMTQSILGAEIKKHPTKEISWFRNQLQEIISKTVYPKAYDFLLNVKLEHEMLEKSTTKFSVLTLVKKRGEESEVVSKFKKINNQWRIIDITIDDESWVENIREQVKKTIQKKKWAGLKTSLTKRLEDLKSGKEVKTKLDED